MNKKVLTVAGVFVALLATSCEMPQQFIEVHHSQARVLDVVTASEVIPVKGELEVNPDRIEDRWTFTAEEINALGGDLERIHARAAFKTLQKYQADELVAPLYDVYSNPDGSYTVIVMGYTGNFVNWQSTNKSNE